MKYELDVQSSSSIPLKEETKIEDYYLSDIRVHGLSNTREERIGPAHLHFSSSPSPELKEMHPRFSDAVFQSARILSKQNSSQVKEQGRSYVPHSAPSIELLYLSHDGNHGIGVTVLFHQSGPSVICYSKSSPQKSATPREKVPIPRMLESLSIGYENRYSYFNLPNVEKNCQNQ
ncbi:hypothetical protein ACOI1C_06890 [Bacillus sp. DJP31]|uniref:hypothetical protein n=1 Tax=Bacillus sp. DJP31 TaxID=3409789 RepID=UPI003BB59C62